MAGFKEIGSFFAIGAAVIRPPAALNSVPAGAGFGFGSALARLGRNRLPGLLLRSTSQGNAVVYGLDISHGPPRA
jgi:hypothetical protein